VSHDSANVYANGYGSLYIYGPYALKRDQSVNQVNQQVTGVSKVTDTVSAAEVRMSAVSTGCQQSALGICPAVFTPWSVSAGQCPNSKSYHHPRDQFYALK